MTANVEFSKLKKRLGKCSSESEKMKILKALLDINPSYPPLAQEKKKFRAQMEAIGRKHKKPHANTDVYDIKRSGFQIGLLGTGNSGKSTILSSLTDSDVEIRNYPFSSYRPEIGNMDLNDVNVQLIKIPSIYEEDSDKTPAKYRFIQRLDEIVLVTNLSDELRLLLDELSKAGINIVDCVNSNNQCDEKNKSGIVTYREPIDYSDLVCIDVGDKDSLLANMYKGLRIKRIYPRKEGVVEKPPVTFPLDEETTVEDFIYGLDKRLRRRYKEALIWGDSAEFPGQRVGVKHVLKDGDAVNLL